MARDRIIYKGEDLAELHQRIAEGEIPCRLDFPVQGDDSTQTIEALNDRNLAEIMKKDNLFSDWCPQVDVWRLPMVAFSMDYAVLPHAEETE